MSTRDQTLSAALHGEALLVLRVVSSFTVLGWDNEVCRLLRRWRFGLVIILD